jgi:outer membrane protein assembly factor BamB
MIPALVCALILAPGTQTADNWPQFRGPLGDGICRTTGLPLAWSETQHVKWKTPIHGKAWSSPVIWGNQVWVTTATEDGRQLFAVCVDRSSGKVLLDRKLFDNPNPEPLGNDVNSYASPTPAIEEGRVFLHFGSPGTAALDTKTFKTLWTRRDLPCRHYRGPSSSPVLYKSLLILTFDGADLQYTTALDKRTGKTIWKTDRTATWNDLDSSGRPSMEGDNRKAHSTPILREVGGRMQLLSPGAKAAYGYDPDTGRELWKVDHTGVSCSTMPAVGHGMVYFNNGYGGPKLMAVRLGGSGNVTGTHVAWTYSRNVPSKPSPLLVGDYLYMIQDGGVATCLDAKTGAEVWKERIGGNYAASPLYAEGRIYCFSEQGNIFVFKAAPKFEKLTESKMADGFMATPAAVGHAFYVRTRTALYRVE